MFRILTLLTISLHSPQPDLEQALRFWQNELQLAEWRVSVEVVADNSLDHAALGDIRWEAVAKTARVRVLREEDYDIPVKQARRDQEETVVHELVHLRHASDRPQPGGDEQAVVRETNALLRAYRKGR